MAAITSNDYRIFNVESMLRSVEGSNPDTFVYLFLGNSLSWNETHGMSDATPPTPLDNLNSKNFIRENMMFLKRILRSEMSHGIRKIKWEAGNFYDYYRSDYGDSEVTGVTLTSGSTVTYPQSLEYANYYAITSNGNIYLCLSNNNNSPSTSNPQDFGAGSGYEPFATSDGYVWKFIAATSPSDFSKFSTIDFHPVKNILTQPISGDPYENQFNAQDHATTQGGAIYTILVKTAGTNTAGHVGTIGTLGDQTMFTITGDGSGLKLSATFSSGSLSKITVLSYGTGYTYCNVTITGVSGSVLVPIFTPLSGLGSNPVYDLNANYLLVDTKIEGTDSADYIVDNEFRQLGLIVNPQLLAGGQANSDTMSACYVLTLSETGLTFDLDAMITNDALGTKARVVAWDSGTKKLTVNLARPVSSANWSTNSGFVVGNTVTQSGGDTGTITAITPPDIAINTGRIIYFENRKPVLRNVLQTEDIHIVLEY